jgi:hypothetical protein
MRSCVTALLCGLVICGLAVSAAQAGEKVDSPMYKHWAKFKPGAFAEMKTESTVMADKTETKSQMTVTMTLKEITPEKAVVEIKAVNVMGDKKMEMPPTNQEYPAKIEEEKAKEMDTPKKGDNIKGAEVIAVGEEEIKVGDKKIKCKWVETKMKQGDSTITSKAWTTEEVPGQVVKTVTSMEGQTKMTSEGSLVKFGVGGSDKADKTEPKAGSEKEKSEKKDAGDKKPATDAKDKTEKK